MNSSCTSRFLVDILSTEGFFLFLDNVNGLAAYHVEGVGKLLWLFDLNVLAFRHEMANQ